VSVDEFLPNAANWASMICYAAAAVGCVYALIAAWVARGSGRWVPATTISSYPAVTILKPLHGAEHSLYDNLAGFCAQDYPSPVQIVFGVDDPSDPAIEVVQRLIADFPDCDLTLTVSSRGHGSNRKVSNLINMVSEARNEVLVISDSDIVVGRDYLKSVTASLATPGVGLVTCLYHGAPAIGTWARLSTAAIDYHFLPSVLVGLKFGLATPCFGSTIALRQETLRMIGGFEAVADHLADDYALGAAVRRAGLAVAMPSCVVAHVCAERSAREVFSHELRWARTIRTVDPLGYCGLVLTHALPFALLGILFGGVTPAASIAVVALACRFILQTELDRVFQLGNDLFWLGPWRDILSFAVFVVSFFGRGVEWRGHRYSVLTDDTLVAYSEANP
jgi:ceramide glucosyltransferase